jgi:hypothetical protein
MLIINIIAILSTGIVYGTDVFFALIVKKAVKKSNDHSISDLIAHIHLVADKRMPPIGMISILSSLPFITGWPGLIAVLSLLAHLILYLTIAKPINTAMTNAVKENSALPNIRVLQQKWDSIITIRALLLTTAMIALMIARWTS